MQTVVALYDTVEQARDAVSELVDAGFSRDNISLMASDPDETYSAELGEREAAGDRAAEGMAGGALAGGALGGLTGILLGAAALAIPGIGPIVALGPVAAGLTGAGVGAVTGGVLGALVGWGIPEEEAHYYSEGLRRGGTLVSVRATEGNADQAARIMNRHRPVDITERAEMWREEGWGGRYDPDADPWTGTTGGRYGTTATDWDERTDERYVRERERTRIYP